jgi:hypothetical protein
VSRVRQAGRVLVVAACVIAALWLSAHITVRLPLVVPVLFIGIILGLVAVMFRRPPPTLFQAAAAEPAPAPAATAIPMPPVTEPPVPAATWAFDEPDTDPREEGW